MKIRGPHPKDNLEKQLELKEKIIEDWFQTEQKSI